MSTSEDLLFAAMIRPRPCDTCAHLERCATHHQSCLAFAEYVYSNKWNDSHREPSRWHFRRLFKMRDTEPQSRPGPRSGLKPATLVKIDALRSLTGEFSNVRDVLSAVRLSHAYWSRIRATDAELTAHVRSLVKRRPRHAQRTLSKDYPFFMKTRERILALHGPYASCAELAEVALTTRGTVYLQMQLHDDVRAHVRTIVATFHQGESDHRGVNCEPETNAV